MSEPKAISDEQRRARDIALAEYAYWSRAPETEGAGPDTDIIALGAIGACANIVAALSGHLAPWHKQYLERKENSGESCDNG